MNETDAKRSKIGELLEYIDTRLTELEEEKEELKEFQEKDRDRRCLEYALYQRELEEVAEALEEIEEERRGEVHGANVRREQFSDREQQIQVYMHALTILGVTDSRWNGLGIREADIRNQTYSHDAIFDSTWRPV